MEKIEIQRLRFETAEDFDAYIYHGMSFEELQNKVIYRYEEAISEEKKKCLQEIEKAREEGYRKGAKDMFDDCECFPIPKDVLEEFIKNNFNK